MTARYWRNRHPGVRPIRRSGPFWWFGLAALLLALALAAQPARAQAGAGQAEAARPTAAQLADLLENEDTRNALIRQLRELSADGKPGGEAAAAPAGGQEGGLTQRVADRTQALLADIADSFADAATAFRSLGRGEGVRGITMERWMSILGAFAVVLAATLAGYLALRAAASFVYRRMDAWVAARTEPDAGRAASPDAAGHAAKITFGVAYRRALAVVGALAVDLGIVALAALVGYAVGLYALEPRGAIAPLDQAFVKAFLAVESAKAMVRMVYATRYPHLRLVAVSDESARYWNRWMSRLVGITGYSIMIVGPMAKAMFSPAVGQMFGLAIMLGVYVYAVRVIWANRLVLRARLLQAAQRAATAFVGTAIGVFARTWHWLAIGYFSVLLVTSQLDPENALQFMAAATFQTVVAVAVGIFVSAMLSAMLSRRIRLSDDLRARLPMLEARVNAYVPVLLRGCRALVMVGVLLVVLDAWYIFDLPGWVSSESGSRAIAVVVQVAIVLLIALLVWTVIASLIEHRLSGTGAESAPSAREQTLLALLRNAALIVIIAMTLMVVLSQIGVDVGPLLAGAGVVGLAIGFGAQKLVQDIITGVFIQIENGMNQNDVVQVAGVFGTVEKITIRSVGIRTLDGGYHLIPFSSVDTVTNHMRDFSYHLGEYTIAYRESVDDAIYHLERAFEELKQDEVLAPEILEDMTIPGVTALTEKGFTIRVLIKTRPGMQWAVQRGFNRLVKKHFNAANIELPYPHTVVYFGQDKNGDAPPARWREQAGEETPPRGGAPAAGHTPRSLGRRVQGRSEDVLGNEMERTVDDEGNPLQDGGGGTSR